MIDSDRYTKYFGFTEEEVKVLCDKYKMDFEQVKAWYNGYVIGGTCMYNPNSVYEAMTRRKLDTYWKNTSAFSTINKFLLILMDLRRIYWKCLLRAGYV